jgi:histidinol-phosphate aminotransferase
MRKPETLARSLVAGLHAYVPGEQPKIKGLIKLNTNENPYPPSAKVLAAIRDAVDGRIRLYPNPTSQTLREKLAKLHRCAPENIIIGNGSDELLAMATRTFVEPVDTGRGRDSRSTIQYFTPSYSLYPVLAAIHGARTNAVRLADDFSLPPLAVLKKSKAWDFHAALTLVTTPNVLDEAYVDFAEENALHLALKHPHVLVARTFSKAYSLCFQRVGYFVGHPELIAALDKLRDSYNVNGLGQVAALATLGDLGHYRSNFRRIKATRTRLGKELGALGFEVLPSQTNFILARPPAFPASEWLKKLRDRKILVRWFSYPEVKDYIRITIGTDAEANALVKAAKAILSVKR